MYSVFRNLAIIILSAKFFGLVARKCKAPQVVGEIIAGLIIGPCLLNLVHISDTISIFAEIGVVLLMFSTGLGTNLRELIKAGPIATLIACVGVAVPLAGGTLLYSLFYGFSALGSQEFYRALFIGTIMTATSVSITVATLQELGHLKSFLGTTIVSAAVIDDVIGIVVLTCVLGASSGTGTGLGKVLMNTVLFFATAIGVGIIAHFAMKWLDKRNPHTQRITIVSMAFCFAMAYIAEAYFGIADITGAYIAGIVLCTLEDAPYVERRVDISNYVLFAPIFFASIGLKTDISGLTPEILLFSVCFVVVALITKIIGCADLFGFIRRPDEFQAAAHLVERNDLPADAFAQFGPRLFEPRELVAQPLPVDIFVAGLLQAAGHEFGIVVKNGPDVPLGLVPRFPRSDAPLDVQLLHGGVEQHFEKGRRGQRADTDLEAVRHRSAVVFQVLHVPQMAELVFGARSRAARLRGLHGETAQQQPFGQLFDLLHIARMHACGIGQSLFQPVLHQSEGEIVHRLRLHGVGKHPVGPGRDLGDQVGVARSRHSGGRSRRNRRIENHAQRRRTVEGLLVAVLGDRGSVGRVTIHRSRRADHHVTAAVVVGAEFGQVVDHARTDGHADPDAFS